MSVPETPASPAPPSEPVSPPSQPAASVGEPVPPVGEPAPAETAPSAGEAEFDDYEPLTPELVEEEAIRGDFVLRWAVVLLALLLGSTRIAETGALVHIKTGQYLASHGLIPPAHDVFSYTAQERPWTNLSWGFDLLTAGIYAIGSFTGVSVLKAVVLGIAFWLLGRISRTNLPTWWGSICGAAALLACHTRILAEPALVTYLGLALLLIVWFQWRESPGSRTLWLAVPLLIVWSNLDPRAWLGWGFLALYALGDMLAAFLQSPSALPAQPRKTLLAVTGASLVGTMLHPFGWKSLAAPWLIYGVEYPALRDYIAEAYLGNTTTLAGSALAFFPMTTEAFWTSIDLAALAALGLFVAALVAFFMNRARLDWGQVAVLVGFGVAAVLCLHELPAAAIVAAALATINGQAWYAAACRQTYSIETSELLFSRGGRALTVLTFAAIAFFGGTGRLREATLARTGYGLAHDLQVQLEDLQRQLGGEVSYDHKPFNTYLTQGDQLIWIGEQVFADSRVGVYYAADDDDNLLRQHLRVMDALRPRRESGSSAGATRRSVWSKPLDKYEVTHVVARLASVRDYEMLVDLLQDTTNWEWTGLGSACAVFYRRDLKDPKVQEFVQAHKIDFRKRAFREDFVFRGSEEGIGARDRSVRPPSFYQRYFWAAKRDAPAQIHEALHLVRLASVPGLPRTFDVSRPAMVALSIRLAQEGLSSDPDAVEGYIALGMAYDFLSQLEGSLATGGLRSPRSGMRYFQSIAAYNQALVGDPDNLTARLSLRKLYHEAGKRDLELEQLEALDAAISESSSEQAEQAILEFSNEIRKLREQLQELDSEMAQRSAAQPNPLSVAAAYYQQGCVLRALREFERDPNAVAGNLGAEQFRIRLLLEAGRTEEASLAAGRFVEAARMSGLREWADDAALAALANADYITAMQYWQDAATEADERSSNGLLLSLALHPGQQPWPLSTTTAAFDYLYQRPENVAAQRMNVALLYVEQGQIKLAEQALRDVLAANPDTRNRNLVAYYLNEITDGKAEFDPVPPADRVVEVFADEDEGSESSE